MTRQGRVYERVSGETLPVEDPALLDRLFRRGRAAADRAEEFANHAARRALYAPELVVDRRGTGRSLYEEQNVAVAVGLAPVGRETDDIASRLFAPAFHEAANTALASLVSARGVALDETELWQEQDAITAAGHFRAGHLLARGGVAIPKYPSTWLVQGTWDGAVTAAASLSVEAVTSVAAIEDVVLPGWRAIVPLVEQLGGYGPAHLAVFIYARQPPEYQLAMFAQETPVPPAGTLYADLPERETVLGRTVSIEPPAAEIIASLTRELERASGRVTFEHAADADGDSAPTPPTHRAGS